MILKTPEIDELRDRCARGNTLLISAPFYTAEGLNWVRPENGGRVEFWTRLNPHDWKAGVCDPPALLSYLESIEDVCLRVHRALHAKIYQVDSNWSWIGSPNLTRAAFTSNIELVAELASGDVDHLQKLVSDLRTYLYPLDLATFRDWIDIARDAVKEADADSFPEDEDLQAAVSLADEILSPQPQLTSTEGLPNLESFIAFVRGLDGAVPTMIVDHHDNRSHQNRQGHVKQSYYALAQFLSRDTHAQRVSDVLAQQDLDGYPALPPKFITAWVPFLDRNARHKDDTLGYSFSTLRRVLPERLGGYVIGGGGASGTFTRMVPLVARYLATKP